VEELAVGGHDLGGQQRIDRQAVLARQVADATAKGEAADADRAGVPEADGQPVRGRRGRDLAGGQSRLCPRGATLDVDVERLHVTQVEHDPDVGGAVAGAAVAAAAHGELRAGLARQRDDRRDVGCVRDAHDHGRSGIELAGHDRARGVVFGVARRDDAAPDGGSQLVDGDGGGRG
jgi:hypothetical protein